jgi:hypothetical protein
MAFAFDVVSGVVRLRQTGTDTSYGGIATAINAVATVARSTAYAAGAIVRPPAANGLWYRCATAGTTAATAPTYGTTEGANTTDGTAIFNAFLAPITRTIAGGNHYYMPSVRMQIDGTLTNTNPQQNTFTCFDVEMNGGNWTSGAYASDGVTPLWNGTHFIAMRQGSAGAEESDGGLRTSNNAQFTFIGGEVQVGGSIVFNSGTTPRTYGTRWRNSREFGATSARIRNKTANAIFSQIELFDIAFDLFVMPTFAPSIKARGSEYLYQYVGSQFGGADARFVAFDLENPNGQFDFDNFGSGWVELYNCKAGAALRVVTQHPSSTFWVKHCVPLYQELRFNAKDTAGLPVQDVRFAATETPTNSPTVLFVTQGNLKTWDFRNALSYETTTNASGIALSTPILNVWYWQTTFKQSLRFPSSTAVYQGRAYNYKTLNVSAVLGSSTITDISAGMINLDTATTITETAASAITGISLVPSGATGGTITISSNKSYQDIWNYYRYWISQFANDASNDTWTCTGGTLNTQNWNIVVNTGVIITSSTNITKLQTLGTITLTGTAQIQGIYQDSTGTSTTLQISGFDAGSSVYVEDNLFVQKFYSASASGTVTVYIPPTGTGSWYYAVEKYGIQRQSDFFTFSGGLKSIVVKAIPDTGITVTNQSTVAAYTVLENPDKVYDYVAYLRLSVPHISYGQITFKNGTSLDMIDASILVNQSFGSVAEFDYDNKILTIKSTSLSTGVTYDKIITTPPETIEANTTEVITVEIEDANGDSSINIQGGSGSFSIFKFPIATTAYPSAGVDDRISPTNLVTATAGNGKYRFIADPLYNYMVLDNSQGNKSNIPKENIDHTWNVLTKGAYTAGLFQGEDQISLAQVNEVYEILSKVDILLVDTNSIKGTGFTKDTHSLINIKQAVDALENYDDTLTQTKLDSIQDTVDNISVDFTPVLNAVDALPTLAEIEASTVLTKEAAATANKDAIIAAIGTGGGGSCDLTEIEADLVSIKASVDTIQVSTNKMTFDGHYINAVAKVVEDKANYTLTPDEKVNIANAVQAAILNETDGQKILEAIVNAIGNENIDQVALVAAIRADIERTGGMLATKASEANATTNKNTIASAIGTPLQASSYTAPDNATIAKINDVKAKTDNLPTNPASSEDVAALGTSLSGNFDAIPTKEEIRTEVWLNQPERLTRVSTVETTGNQIAAFND